MPAEVNFVIQAGHEGGKRNSGTGVTTSIGTGGEIDRTPVIADQITKNLRDAGYTVARVGGVFPKKFTADIFMACHFDGSTTACASGTSFGYPEGVPAGSNKPSVDIFREAYVPYVPFNAMRDNFTKALSGYYGYSWVSTTIAEFLVEFGELTCPEDRAWLDARLADGWLGKVSAHALEKAYLADNPGTAKIPHPGDWRTKPEPKPEPVACDCDAELEAIRQVNTAQGQLIGSQEQMIKVLQRQVAGLTDDLQGLLTKLRNV